MPPLSLYIHIPWCIQKCPYCDFNSHKSPNQLPEQQYIECLLADLENDLPSCAPPPIQSIFLGGGTPSLLSAEAYRQLFEGLTRLSIITDNLEITLEANPGAVEQQRFRDYRALGINRLSLGIQSFNSDHLKKLGRIHDDQQAHQAIESARLAGFDNLNLDLMHGLPGQTIAEGIHDLQIALSYQPEHLSWYQLTIEPNTIYYKQQPILPNEHIIAAIEASGLALLKEQGFNHYEISAFCQPKHESRHNLNYWLFGDYYGIGAGAHGKFTVSQNQIVRSRKYKQPKDYMNKERSFIAERNTLTQNDLIFEFMLNTTRLNQKIELSLFSERTNLSVDILLPHLKHAQSKGLINLEDHSWQVTELGRRYTNNLQALFILD
ncbi:MAG: radical SAM family heme chaperone HemW [Legionella sp.]